MLKTIKTIAITALATMGVLFLILMILPESEEETAEETAAVETETPAEETGDIEAPEENDTEESLDSVRDEIISELEESGGFSSGAAIEKEDTEESREEETEDKKEDDKENASPVNIPASEVSDFRLSFKTTTLDGEKVTEDIFSDYDITVVYFWGTYCGNCIAEMGDYAAFYKELPDNVNLIGIIGDVYDGLDNNVKSAKNILSDAGAEFTNLKTSDSVYEITGNIQYFPSSFLVDREGHVVGSLLEGARFDYTRENLNKYLK